MFQYHWGKKYHNKCLIRHSWGPKRFWRMLSGMPKSKRGEQFCLVCLRASLRWLPKRSGETPLTGARLCFKSMNRSAEQLCKLPVSCLTSSAWWKHSTRIAESCPPKPCPLSSWSLAFSRSHRVQGQRTKMTRRQAAWVPHLRPRHWTCTRMSSASRGLLNFWWA